MTKITSVEKNNITKFCQKIGLFQSLSLEQINHIAEITTLKHFKKNAVIFLEEQKAACFYVLYSGKVKVFKLSTSGKEQILHLLHPPEILAEVPMFQGENYPASCMAIEESVLLSISREQLIKLIKTEPQIALNLLALQAKRLREFTLQLESMAIQDTSQRLLNYLISKKNKENIVKLDLSLTTLANLLGVSRENLSRTISKLVKEKIITYSKKQIKITHAY